jgi:hypothetical protein
LRLCERFINDMPSRVAIGIGYIEVGVHEIVSADVIVVTEDVLMLEPPWGTSRASS